MIFNNGTHNYIADRAERAARTIVLKHGEKMIFGKDNEKGLALDYSTVIPHLIVVPADDERVLVHDATTADPTLHRMLALMGQPDTVEAKAEMETNGSELPIALGVIRNVAADTYDQAVHRQINDIQATAKVHCFDDLTKTLETW